jgi:hypothetical protein
MSADGCLIDAALILSKEEYTAKVFFDREVLLQVQGLSSSLLHDELISQDEENKSIITIDFGDLLTHVPLVERAKWQQYYRGIKTDAPHSIYDNHLDKLLFFDFKNIREYDTAVRCWQARLDNLVE